jgi:hypothetical protein
MRVQRMGPLDLAKAADGIPMTRLVLFTPEHPHYTGRRARRERMLGLRPVDPTEAVAAPPPSGDPTALHWEYLLPDDSSLLARARDVADADEARWDALRLFDGLSPLRIVYVRDREGSHVSWWLARGTEPVLVASRVWLTSQRGGAVRSARRALAATRATAPAWGGYAG